jgi:hypothetical protein
VCEPSCDGPQRKAARGAAAGVFDFAGSAVERELGCSLRQKVFADLTRLVEHGAAGVSPEVAHIQLAERTDLSTPAIGAEHLATFTSTAEVLRKIGVIDASVDLRVALDSWVDGSYLRSVG